MADSTPAATIMLMPAIVMSRRTRSSLRQVEAIAAPAAASSCSIVSSAAGQRFTAARSCSASAPFGTHAVKLVDDEVQTAHDFGLTWIALSTRRPGRRMGSVARKSYARCLGRNAIAFQRRWTCRDLDHGVAGIATAVWSPRCSCTGWDYTGTQGAAQTSLCRPQCGQPVDLSTQPARARMLGCRLHRDSPVSREVPWDSDRRHRARDH